MNVYYSPETRIHAEKLFPEQVQKLISASTWIVSADVRTNCKSTGACRCFVVVFSSTYLFLSILIQINCLVQILLTESLQAVIVLRPFEGQFDETKKRRHADISYFCFHFFCQMRGMASIHKLEHKIRNLSLLGIVCGQK